MRRRLTDILEPMKSAFAPATLETASLYNGLTKKKGYYGFPLKQQSMHVQIWGDMLMQGLPDSAALVTLARR